NGTSENISGAAQANVNLPKRSVRLAMLLALGCYGIVGLALFQKDLLFYLLCGLGTQAFSAVVLFFATSGWLLDGPRNKLAPRLGNDRGATVVPLGTKLLWACTAPALAVATCMAMSRHAEVGNLIATGIIGVLCAVLVALLASRDIVRSIHRLTTSAERLA